MVPVPNGRLWQAIREAGLNQREFSRIVGIHEAHVSRVVHGRMVLDAGQQAKWARALKRRPEELFGERAA